jgi:hypothetical protein
MGGKGIPATHRLILFSLIDLSKATLWLDGRWLLVISTDTGRGELRYIGKLSVER